MKSKGSVIWLVRLLLISRVVIVLLALVFALVLWQRNTTVLMESVDKLSTENPNIEMLERGITTLYKAENNFRFYSATYERAYFNEYRINLLTVSGIIDSLQTSLSSTNNISTIGKSLDQKADISDIVIRLKMLTDSLLIVAQEWDTNSVRKVNIPEFDIKKIQNFQKITAIDTLTDTTSTQKKGFIQKIKSLFKDDATPEKKNMVIKRSEEIHDTVIQTNTKSTPEYELLQDIHSFYSNKINSYSDGRSRLNTKEKALATINSLLIEEITTILRQVKQSELEATNAIKNEAVLTGEKSARTISVITVFSVLITAVFFFLVIYYLRKIKENSAKLESEKNRAEKLVIQKSSFLSGMSHEIRAPLNNILGFTEQLRTTPDENREKYLQAINISAELMVSTVNQILDFSKLESGKMTFSKTPFSPFKAIESAASTLILRAKEKKLMLNLHLPVKEDFTVYGDEFRLKQIIVNLIDNAIKYTEKGEVNVRAHIRREGSIFSTFIEVSDTGIGIPADRRDDVFNEFERLEDNGNRRWQPGTGLGLPIAKMVIEQQGGKIYIKESSEKGTVFAIELPYQLPPSEMTLSTKPETDYIIKQGKTILLADDDEFSILLISVLCKKYNINLVSAENGQIAFDLLTNRNFDLILTDINMPVLSGIDFAKKLRNTPGLDSLPLIAVTANVMNDDIKNITQAGFNEILFKPFREKDFIEKISLFLQ